MSDKAPENKLEEYRLMCKLGEGTFSEVLKVKHKKTGKAYAMKRFRKHFDGHEEIENLREIQALRRLNPHPHIIDLQDVIFDPKHGILCLAFDIMDCNLYELLSRKHVSISEPKAKLYMWQVMRAMEFMHGKGIFHRDIKPENILIKDNIVKLADFGSCRSIHSKQPYTEYIATRWYRSPECLLCDGVYTYKMDIWGAGCVLFEVISKVPLFPGTNELDQLHRIHNVLGTPSQKTLKRMLGGKTLSIKYNFPVKDGTGIRPLLQSVTQECIDLLNLMLTYDPDERINAKECLKHSFLRDVDLSEIQPQLDAIQSGHHSLSTTTSSNNENSSTNTSKATSHNNSTNTSNTTQSTTSKPSLPPSSTQQPMPAAQPNSTKKLPILQEAAPKVHVETNMIQPLKPSLHQNSQMNKARRSASLPDELNPPGLNDKKAFKSHAHIVSSTNNTTIHTNSLKQPNNNTHVHSMLPLQSHHAPHKSSTENISEHPQRRKEKKGKGSHEELTHFKSTQGVRSLEMYKATDEFRHRRRARAHGGLILGHSNSNLPHNRSDSNNNVASIQGMMAVGIAKRRPFIGLPPVNKQQNTMIKLPSLPHVHSKPTINDSSSHKLHHLGGLNTSTTTNMLPQLDLDKRKLNLSHSINYATNYPTSKLNSMVSSSSHLGTHKIQLSSISNNRL